MHPEHVHLVAVGESIHKTLPPALNHFQTTHLILVVEEAIYADPGPKKKHLILEAMEAVKSTARDLNIETMVLRLPRVTLADIRDAVLTSYATSPGANYYFNITGGSKVLSNGLFLMSLWVGGTAYYIDQEGGVQVLKVPRMHTNDVTKNPNYLAILETLAKPLQAKPYKTVFLDMQTRYVPIRERDRKTKRALQKGTFSKWVRDLSEWGLLVESPMGSSRREKTLAITEDGLFALKLITATAPRA